MLALDPKTTALVIVDLQYGILSNPLTPHDGAHVLARSVELGQAFATAGGVIALVHVDYSEGYADRPNQPADAPMRLPPEGLPPDWATLAPEVAALPAQVHITKRQQSAFFGTELDLQLRRRGIATVVICGVATNFGVEATARRPQPQLRRGHRQRRLQQRGAGPARIRGHQDPAEDRPRPHLVRHRRRTERGGS